MGRRLILLLSAMATMVVVSAGVALAVSQTYTDGDDDCNNPPTGYLPATSGADQLAMGGGNDTCNGLGGADWIKGDHGNDDLAGASGGDALFGSTGDDTFDGGFGNDFVNSSDNVGGNDEIDCGPGVDKAVKDLGDFSTRCDGNVTVVP
jgi:Ca2+-binding RTX toxin-like protein